AACSRDAAKAIFAFGAAAIFRLARFVVVCSVYHDGADRVLTTPLARNSGSTSPLAAISEVGQYSVYSRAQMPTGRVSASRGGRTMRMRLGAVFAAAAAIVMAAVLAVAAGPASAADVKFVKKSPLTIGYSIQSAQDPYWQGYIHGIEHEMQKYGFTKMLTQDSQASAQKQVSGSLALIHAGISALIISPQEPSALVVTEAAAHRAHIPVIVGDVGAAGDYDGFVLSDNYHGGQLAAQFVEKALAGRKGVQEVGIISLKPTTTVNGPRTAGFTQTVAKDPNLKVVADISGQQTLEGGFKAAQAILAANPKVAALYCLNDSMAAGAEQAIEQAGGRNPLTDPVLVGFNGDPIALKLIEEGKLAADVAQNPYQQGIVAVDMAWAYLEGKTPSFTDPAKKIVSVPVELVTPQTLPAFMKLVKEGKAY
ncbi:MAG: substrate-binding domain-containing protein, partial [Acetobacteraceae bacterium]